MVEQRGRKSEAERQVENVVPTQSAGNVQPLVRAPKDLGPAAANLWRSIVASRPATFFSAGDWPLLVEYCRSIAELVPRLNAQLEQELDLKALDARDKLVRQAAALSRTLRICVSSRTRGDSADMRRDGDYSRPIWS